MALGEFIYEYPERVKQIYVHSDKPSEDWTPNDWIEVLSQWEPRVMKFYVEDAVTISDEDRGEILEQTLRMATSNTKIIKSYFSWLIYQLYSQPLDKRKEIQSSYDESISQISS